jgi:hypothetical protein
MYSKESFLYFQGKQTSEDIVFKMNKIKREDPIIELQHIVLFNSKIHILVIVTSTV